MLGGWSGAQQVSIDRTAEAPDRKSGHQQRHAEVKISIQKGLETGGRPAFNDLCMHHSH
jgi:hypothetical protein